MKTVPWRSNCKNFSLRLAGAGLIESGVWKKNNTTAREAPATGRLIQKHHLHDSFSVRTPPSSGPATLAILKSMPTRAKYIATCFGGTMQAMMV
jgi:hypothetical protein